MRSITLCLLVAICISMSFGDFDYTISDTYYDDTLTLNSESVQVTGEGADKIVANGTSYVEVINTTPYVYNANSGIRRIEFYETSTGSISGGDIDTIGNYGSSILNISGGKAGVDAVAADNSVVNMSDGIAGSYFVWNNAKLKFSGGELNGIWLSSNATTTLSGGSINSISSAQYSDSLKHITLICDVDSVNYTGSLLTGNWLNGTNFSIMLNDQSGYDSVYSNIEFIPEPATLILLGLGGLLIRKKN